jgi:DNA-binding response OmpR family regulator
LTDKDKITNHKPIILIVSPPSDLQIGLQALLTTYLEVDVYVTSEGSSALNALARYLPDLVILDQDLPLNSGLEIAREVKSIWPDLIMITFVNDDEGKRGFSELGIDRVITKGLPGPELITEIKTLLQIK